MTQNELMQVLQAGESSMVEFKRCSELPHTDTFETVCSFANRSGGSIYLGVDDDGQVLGVDSKRVSEIERNVVNVVSNRKMFEPAPMVGNGTYRVRRTDYCSYLGSSEFFGCAVQGRSV